jgi:hypothetical protein
MAEIPSWPAPNDLENDLFSECHLLFPHIPISSWLNFVSLYGVTQEGFRAFTLMVEFLL